MVHFKFEKVADDTISECPKIAAKTYMVEDSLAEWSRRGKLGLVDVAVLSRNFSASVENDHVFAFLGHATLQGLIEPDYSWTVYRTNMKVAERIFERSQSLDMLCAVDNREELASSSSVPSWVLQWHKPRLYRGIVHSEWQSLKESATGMVATVSGNGLRVAALFVDSIADHSRTLGDEDFERTPSVIEELWSMYPNADCINFRSTLTWGSYCKREFMTPDFFTYCRHHCTPTFVCFLESQPIFKPSSWPASPTRYFFEVYTSCRNRRFFTISRGICGRGPGILRKDDILALVFGCRMPLILRPTHNADESKLVSFCYSVHWRTHVGSRV